MSRKSRIIGKRFGRLKVVERVSPPKTPNPEFLCKCDCGGNKVVKYNNLKKSATKSCGCLKLEVMAELIAIGKINRDRRDAEKANKQKNKPPSKTLHELYDTWVTMKRRCYDKNHTKYPYYGAKGVTVCDRWRDGFWAFVADMGDRPSAVHSVDRIDPTGNYEPGNCRWADVFTQATNKRVPGHMFMVDIGRGLEGLTALCKKLDIQPETVRRDARKGMNPALAVISAWYRKRKYVADGGAGGYAMCESQARDFLAKRGIVV